MAMSRPPQWEVEFFKEARGCYPVREWLLGVDENDRARALPAIELLADYGLRLGAPHTKHGRSKIWELRIGSGCRDYRVLYFAAAGQTFVLLHAFLKKKPKTPRDELTAAERRLTAHESKSEKGS